MIYFVNGKVRYLITDKTFNINARELKERK